MQAKYFIKYGIRQNPSLNQYSPAWFKLQFWSPHPGVACLFSLASLTAIIPPKLSQARQLWLCTDRTFGSIITIPGADAPAFVRALTRPKPKPPFEWAFHVFTTIQSKEKEDKKVCFVL